MQVSDNGKQLSIILVALFCGELMAQRIGITMECGNAAILMGTLARDKSYMYDNNYIVGKLSLG